MEVVDVENGNHLDETETDKHKDKQKLNVEKINESIFVIN